LQNAGFFPPSPEHTVVDHIDGDSMNNTLANLRWATPKQNAKNKGLNRGCFFER
jgi:hypothetical protein